MISLVIPGEPCGKQRPKFVRATGRAYTPTKTVNAETLIRETFATAYPGHEPLAGPLKMTVIAYFSIPKSASAKRKLAMRAREEWPTKKPDASNILKLAEDA